MIARHPSAKQRHMRQIETKTDANIYFIPGFVDITSFCSSAAVFKVNLEVVPAT